MVESFLLEHGEFSGLWWAHTTRTDQGQARALLLSEGVGLRMSYGEIMCIGAGESTKYILQMVWPSRVHASSFTVEAAAFIRFICH